jgi:ribosomal protein L11 methyltransferase
MSSWELALKVEPVFPGTEIMVTELAELGFDSFMETDEGVSAYSNVLTDQLEIKLNRLSEAYLNDFSFTWELIEHPSQNWNHEWESAYEPVIVEDYASVLAPFHKDFQSVGLPIWIQPQMSFGTGHHPTTWLMVKRLFELERIGPKVLDMGTGTGVLAIVAEKLGAQQIDALDVEKPAIENAIENGQLNACRNITFFAGDAANIPNTAYDLIVANINKNVLKAHLPTYFNRLKASGLLLMSGFFETDNQEVTSAAEEAGFSKMINLTKQNWSLLQFIKH